MARLFVLGGGGWVPTPKRSTNAWLIETRRSLILLDCGAGVARLSDPMIQVALGRVPRVLVLLSHWHHDHIAGLHLLPFFLRDHEVTLGCPPAKVTGHAPQDVLARYAGPPLLHTPVLDWGH